MAVGARQRRRWNRRTIHVRARDRREAALRGRHGLLCAAVLLCEAVLKLARDEREDQRQWFGQHRVFHQHHPAVSTRAKRARPSPSSGSEPRGLTERHGSSYLGGDLRATLPPAGKAGGLCDSGGDDGQDGAPRVNLFLSAAAACNSPCPPRCASRSPSLAHAAVCQTRRAQPCR